MDHLSLLEGKSVDELRVPFLAEGVVYKGRGYLPFTTFPWLHGFDFDGKNFRAEARTTGETAGFIQGWLFFGLLTEVLEKPADRSLLLADDGGVKYVSTARLKDLKLPLLALLYRDFDDGIRGNGIPGPLNLEWRRLRKLVKYVEEKVEQLDKLFCDSAWPMAEVLLSVQVLTSTLRCVCMGMFAEKLQPPILQPDSSAIGRKIGREMVGKGWCPSQVRRILTSMPSPVAVYASKMKRYHQNDNIHEKCSEDACVAFNIDEATYKTRHVRKDCDCKFISVPVREMMDIVGRSEIPLVSVKRKHGEEISLSVEAVGMQPYVAFSHVWSDGLGNPHSNSLPICQLERLDANLAAMKPPSGAYGTGQMAALDLIRLSTSYKTRLFWLDTLCIPAAVPSSHSEYQERRELKRKAINTIGPAFASASRVLILDHELNASNVRPDQTDWNEIAIRVLYSTWIGRCWTFEEGMLGRTCQVQCTGYTPFDPSAYTPERSTIAQASSGAGSLGAALIKMALWYLESDRKRYERIFQRRIRRMVSIPLEGALEDAFGSDRWTMAVESPRPRQFMHRFNSCWNELASRQATRVGDRLLIASNMMNLNTFAVSGSSSPMISLLRSLPGVPLSMLYDKGPKIKNPGVFNRWVPLYPSGFKVDGSEWQEWLRWDGQYLSMDASSSTMLLRFDDIGSCLDFVHENELGKHRYKVDFIRQGMPQISTPGVIGMCLVVGRTKLSEWPGELSGCCLFIVERSFEGNIPDLILGRSKSAESFLKLEQDVFKTCVTAVYDCPIRITLTPAGDDKPSAGCRRLTEWTLKLKHDCQSSPVVASTRAPVNKLTSRFLASYGLLLSPAVPFIAIAYMIFHKIAIKNFSSLPLLGKTAVVINYTSIFVAPFVMDLWKYPAAAIFVVPITYAFSKGYVNLSSSECWSLGLMVVAGVYIQVVNMFFRHYLAPRAYKEWLASFSPFPPPESDMLWTARTERAFQIMNKAMDLFLGIKPTDSEGRVTDERKRNMIYN